MEIRTESAPAPAASPPPEPVELPPRVLGAVGDPTAGPTLIVIAAIHGNEPSGYHAFRRVLADLETAGGGLAGYVVGLTGNRRALARGVRFVDQDLNRVWCQESVTGEAGDEAGAQVSEDRETRELWAEVRTVLDRAVGPVSALDLHSTSGWGPAFVVFDDTLANRRLARSLEVPLILGIEEELEGTMLDFLSSVGVRTVGFEAGQHDDPRSVERAECAIWLTLAACGLLERGHPRVRASRRRLRTESRGLPAVVEVRHRHAIRPGSGFEMLPNFRGFQPVDVGRTVARENGQPVDVPIGGLLLMPLYQPQGEDGYFVVRPIKTVWLSVSAALRRLRLDRGVGWLPGVRALDPGLREVEVNRRIARVLPLELFHLLGYRRVAEAADHLRLARRPERATRVASRHTA